MDRLVYYARVSTEEEQQLSALEKQCEENESFILSQKSKGWVFVGKYVDEGKSGTTMDGRKEFLRMIADMEENKFDIIVIKQIDRGWRNLADWKLFETQLINSRKKLFIRLKNEYYNIEDDGSYISTTMDNVFSEWFSRNLSKKINNAQKNRMIKGSSVITSGNMWGYRQEKGELFIVEAEAAIIRQVFEMYAAGVGFRGIVKYFTEQGVRNRAGNNLTLTTLKRIIRNEKYMGTLICGKEHKNFFTKEQEIIPRENWYVHENRIPPIVSKELWEAANKVLMQKRKKSNSEDKKKVFGYFNGSYPLSSKIKCGLCGGTFYHNTYCNSAGIKKSVFQCGKYKSMGNKEKNGGCANISFYEDELMVIARKVLQMIIQDKKRCLAVLDQCKNRNVLEEISVLKSSLKERYAKISKKKNKLLELYTEDLISKDEFKSQNNECTATLGNLEQQINELDWKLTNVINNEYVDFIEFLKRDCLNYMDISNQDVTLLVKKLLVYPNRHVIFTINGTQLESVSKPVPHGTGCKQYPVAALTEPFYSV